MQVRYFFGKCISIEMLLETNEYLPAYKDDDYSLLYFEDFESDGHFDEDKKTNKRNLIPDMTCIPNDICFL